VIDRRTFIVGVAGALLASPLAAMAQQAARVWRIGYLDGSSPSARTTLVEAFKDRLRELGYAPSEYVLDARWAEGYDERLSSLAAELVRDKPDVIVTVGPLSAFAAAQATKTIPIVFVGVGDPVGTGLVSNLARPPANVTGVTLLAIELAPKRLETLTQAVPGAIRVAILWNPANPVNEREFEQARAAAGPLAVTLIPVEFRSPDELDEAFAATARQRPDAVFVLSSPVTFLNRPRIADFALKHRLPMICALREYAFSGCLMSYGPSYADHFRRAAYFVDRILKGAKPGDLPVEQPTKFEFVINLKTAKALGITIPQSLLLRADEVIQ
jgi:putative tryptophan/tyrosine transport system substrate-binding protein